jgi:hypothetical protein
MIMAISNSIQVAIARCQFSPHTWVEFQGIRRLLKKSENKSLGHAGYPSVAVKKAKSAYNF